jgi:hypothetical protein
MDFFIRNSRCEFLGDLPEQINAAAAVAPFIVVPADELEEIAVHQCRAESKMLSRRNEILRDKPVFH